MYKPVIMITRAAKEICIYYSCGYYPFFIWNVGIDITGSNNMQNRKNDYSQEISRLEDENHELRQRCSSYENIFKIMGIKPASAGKLPDSDVLSNCPSEASGPSEQGHDIANTQPQEKVPDKNLKD